ncbi:MAG TPA: glycoside hydrolase family 97 catalytic domain-containing protein [Niabella sp.]|nr:glycoside hydrolase family 97 catalytic domain-containing protein [Niabella sp.]HQX21539.1 glycoside hydrolase family 97 catalytic domain-containing protein [Niabella sp.]HQX42703.1 glycoside hydrolase family 97 catalytic domain-containing protein [Niabella sp.]HRB08445.1 glycoside hydrolase family 97 catalytic domain-containing protein [Niabella sp.]HRB79704.1 glycoside hydrolase family 97 catalytic domain-containing protein [Niabella sp.]
MGMNFLLKPFGIKMKQLISLVIAMGIMYGTATAQDAKLAGPDGKLELQIETIDGSLLYSVWYNKKKLLDNSPLGINTTMGDFRKNLSLKSQLIKQINEGYELNRSKRSQVFYEANELTATFTNNQKQTVDIIFRVSNHDLAFCYAFPLQNEKTSVKIKEEATGFRFPLQTTTFLTPQSDAMIGWKRTKPSYEEPYQTDMPMNTASQYGKGYTFPCLFRVGKEGWVLVSETGVSSSYCASRLGEYQTDGLYRIAFPMAEENDGNGTVDPAFALPGRTPWRTITVGETLKPIVETTVPWDLVKPLYETTNSYQFGKGTWSWILWQDNSINYDDQLKYVDLAAAMGYQYVLVDNWWDKNIGHDKMETLIKYAHSKKVDVFLWYSSSGYWNDIEQGPINRMDNPIVRKREMKWLQAQGVKGIKVDFFGGDKQETMRLYESILSDADDHGLMVIFHGATLPRGWERMYPNFVGSEAVLASENMFFTQAACDQEAFNATLHPFIRNAVASMEFGGTFLNKRLNRKNDGGSIRRTTDAFQLATAVLFQNPLQFFALAPNNLTDASPIALNFLKEVPTTWDDTRFIDGYPGKYVVLARRHGDSWYIAGINAQKETVKLKIDLSVFRGKSVELITDDKNKTPLKKSVKMNKKGIVELDIQSEGGFVLKTNH